MGTFKVLSFILALYFLTSGVLAVPWDRIAKVSPLFNIKTGPTSEGGCGPHLPAIDEAYTEAIQMIEKAKSAIGNLTAGRNAQSPFVWSEWDNQRTYLGNYFRIDVQPNGQQAPPQANILKNEASSTALGEVVDVFDRILQSAYDVNPYHAYRQYISCSGNGFVFKTKDYTVPVNPPVKLNQNGGFPKGGYLLSSDGVAFPDYYTQPIIINGLARRQNIASYWCPALTEAQSTMESSRNIIVLCDLAFQLPTLTQPDRIQEYRLIDNYESLSGVILHELTHVWSGAVAAANQSEPTDLENKAVANLRQVDDQLQVIDTTGTPYLENGHWVVAPKVTNGKKAYGSQNAMRLAMHYPAESVTNAENYVFFALSVWYDKFRWLAGSAIAE